MERRRSARVSAASNLAATPSTAKRSSSDKKFKFEPPTPPTPPKGNKSSKSSKSSISIDLKKPDSKDMPNNASSRPKRTAATKMKSEYNDSPNSSLTSGSPIMMRRGARVKDEEYDDDAPSETESESESEDDLVQSRPISRRGSSVNTSRRGSTIKKEAPAMAEAPAMSAFERRRLENLKANRDILNGLSAAASVISSKPAPKIHDRSTPRVKTPRSSTPIKKETPKPTRMSSRLRGVEANSEVEKRKFEEEEQLRRDEERAKRMRISGDLALSDIKVEGKAWNKGDNFLTEVMRGAVPYERTFSAHDTLSQTSDKDVAKLAKEMSNLQLYETWSPADIKITPERIYSMGFHPTVSKPLIFAADKVGNLGIFDASQEAEEYEDGSVESPAISVFKIHTKTIPSLLFPADAKSVYTASYDSSIRKLDLAKQMTVEIWAPEGSGGGDDGITAIEQPTDDSNIIYFSRLDGGFGRVDMRDPDSTSVWYLQDKKIGGFSLNPALPHLMATASLDRTLKIWDLRKVIAGYKDEKKGGVDTEDVYPMLLGEHTSRLSVSHASWSSTGTIATSSYDDTIKLHSFSLSSAKSWKLGHDIPEDQMEPTASIWHNNQTGRWVTILKPQWQASPLDNIQKFAIGNMNRFVDIYAENGEQVAQLGGDGISAVPAVAMLHPVNNWVCGGTASGKLCLWL